jgi:lipopolysaccharide export system protein LptA
VRANVTVTADRLIAWYRRKAGATSDGSQPAPSAAQPTPGGTQPARTEGQPARTEAQPAQSGIASDTDTGGNEVYRVQAEGHVHIYTQTDQVWGDKATYDLDQAVLVVTGQHLRLTTPNDVVTARDDLEYWSQRHMAVARGDAVVITNDGRRLQGDVLVAYTTDTQPAPGTGTPQATRVADHPGAPANTQDPLLSSGKLQRVDVFGNVLVRTVTDTVTGDRAVYVPDSGIARVAGQVRITRGQNQLNGSEAIVNMKTGVSRLLAADEGRVQGLLVPNDQTNQSLASPAAPPKGGAQRPSAAKAPAAAGKQP